MSHKAVHLGLGSAIQRLMDVEFQYRMSGGRLRPDLVQERDMLLLALDRIPLDIGFDCDGDGIPDTIEIFRQTAETSCCRLIVAAVDGVDDDSAEAPHSGSRLVPGKKPTILKRLFGGRE